MPDSSGRAHSEPYGELRDAIHHLITFITERTGKKLEGAERTVLDGVAKRVADLMHRTKADWPDLSWLPSAPADVLFVGRGKTKVPVRSVFSLHLRRHNEINAVRCGGPAPSTDAADVVIADGTNVERWAKEWREVCDDAGDDAADDGALWITVGEAAKVSGINAGEISRAASIGELKSNGKHRQERRIDAADLVRWHLARSQRAERVESDVAVARKMNNAAKGNQRNQGE